MILQHQPTCPPSNIEQRTHKGEGENGGIRVLGFQGVWESLIILEENGRDIEGVKGERRK